MRVAGYVDQQVTEDAIHYPWRAVAFTGERRLVEGDLQLVEAVLAGLIHARGLAGRADEHAGKHVRQRGVIEPIAEHAAQQVGAAQEGAVGRSRAAENKMVAAASAAMSAVQHEFFRAEAREAGLLV